MKKLAILGATGSIGKSTLSVCMHNPEDYQVKLVTGFSQTQRMLEICRQFKPDYAAMACADAAKELTEELKGTNTKVLSGIDDIAQLVASSEVDTVMAAIVGAAGLIPTLSAVKAGKQILLANKEALVMTGALFIDEVKKSGATLLPVDSEHNAIFQCLSEAMQQQIGHCDLAAGGISHILLTGSGGPFLNTPVEQLARVTSAQAIKHPNWSMGPKISVDSATMMNKGLEYIEAKWLFNTRREQLKVVIHPQSVIHSMVQYKDGSVLAQMGNPDMRTPIAHVMSYPNRIISGVEPLDFLRVSELTFKQADSARYPCLALAIDACYQGQGATTVLNAANEIAVDAFLSERIGFTQIAHIVEQVLTKHSHEKVASLDDILALDRLARNEAVVAISEGQR